jgi:hypothetical protein
MNSSVAAENSQVCTFISIPVLEMVPFGNSYSHPGNGLHSDSLITRNLDLNSGRIPGFFCGVENIAALEISANSHLLV